MSQWKAIKSSLKRTLPRVSRWTAGRRAGRTVVLCYHSVHPTKLFASATPEVFRMHLAWLSAHCDVVSMATILTKAVSGANERPTVALTFDDGYADNYEFAFPLLREYELSATFFVTVGLLEKDPTVVSRLQTLRRSSYEDIRPLDWEHVRTMRDSGMEFGAHTYSHPNLARLARPSALRELRDSKEILQDRLGEKIHSMAYPFGKPGRHFTAETMRLATELGYERACATLSRAVRPHDAELAIPRFFVTNDSLETLRQKVVGDWDLLGVWQERCPLWAAQLFSPEDFLD